MKGLIIASAWWFLAQGTGGQYDGAVLPYGPYPTAQMCSTAQDEMDSLHRAIKNSSNIMECPCYYIVQKCTEVPAWNEQHKEK